MAQDSRFKVWLRWVGYAFLALAIVVPFALISWGRAQRSAAALAPARYRCGDPEIFTTDGGW